MSQPRGLSAVDDFFKWEDDALVEVVADLTTNEKTHFLPLELLKGYFAVNDNEHLQDILTEVFEPEYPPVDPEFILRDHAAIFTILLSIGRGTYIEHFARYEELSDRRLPFDFNHPPRDFPEEEADPNFLDKFCEKQWMYCVPVFDGHMLHKHFGVHRILPVTYKEQLGIEGVASRYVIKIHESHNKLLPTVLPSLTSAPKSPAENPRTNTFILKRYPTKEGESAYKAEVNGFRSMKNADSIIKFYGSFRHGDESNILLEYADRGSLEEYFKRETPPSRGLDIIGFWKAMFQLIDGLKVVHSIRGGHGNVSSMSIVALSNGLKTSSGCKFKFSDFGLPRSKAALEEASVNGLPAVPTYSSPEYDASGNSDRPRISPSWAADIWSLGCVFSEAAIWIADGYDGLIDYRNARMAEIETTPLQHGDCFHDGDQVLQCVLDAHREIEDRLRRSDYITKDVLDSMADEMLWEEDRPSAKALLRKAEGVLSKAQYKLTSTDDFPRPGSRQKRFPPPRLQPPTAPLPPIPRVPSMGLSSILERQHPPNVEKWRSQLPGSQILRPQYRGVDQLSSAESVSNLDRELNGSIASWQLGDNDSITSPLTPFTSPHVSVYTDKHYPNEGRPRTLQSQNSYQDVRPPIPQNLFYERPASSRQVEHPAYDQDFILPNEVYEPVSEAKTIDEMRTRARAASRAGSNGSSSSFPLASTLPLEPPQAIQIPAKSQRRGPGLSLFPYNNSPPSPDEVHPALRQPHYDNNNNNTDAIPRSVPAFPPDLVTQPTELTPTTLPESSMEYLSLQTCLSYKAAHKKSKKASKSFPLPGVDLIQSLSIRDHAFIIDDSSSMTPHWPDVKRLFEALSYITKGFSPLGTELFYTVSYDAHMRTNTSDLCAFLDKKTTAGTTDVSKRLNLQLMQYRKNRYDKIMEEIERERKEKDKRKKKKSEEVRPLSLYVLTDGEWKDGCVKEAREHIEEMVSWMRKEKLPDRHVIVSFISFANTARAAQMVSELANAEFELDIVDCERWTGNVLRMLRGVLERPVREGVERGDDRPSVMTGGTRSSKGTRMGAGGFLRAGAGREGSVISELA